MTRQVFLLVIFERVSTKNYVKDNSMFSCFPFTNV